MPAQNAEHRNPVRRPPTGEKRVAAIRNISNGLLQVSFGNESNPFIDGEVDPTTEVCGRSPNKGDVVGSGCYSSQAALRTARFFCCGDADGAVNPIARPPCFSRSPTALPGIRRRPTQAKLLVKSTRHKRRTRLSFRSPMDRLIKLSAGHLAHLLQYDVKPRYGLISLPYGGRCRSG